MKLGGLIPFTLADYPGRPAAVIFTAGCNLRCPFCHNPELVVGKGSLEPEEVLEFLAGRAGKLQGVCITGGEPTLYPGLVKLLVEIKALGYRIKLDTNGTSPKLLASLLQDGLVDYIALDVKSAPHKYPLVAGAALNPALVAESAALLKGAVPYELRTTAVPNLVELSDIEAICRWIGPVPRYALQQFRPGKTLDPQFGLVEPYNPAWFTDAAEILKEWAEEVVIRGL